MERHNIYAKDGTLKAVAQTLSYEGAMMSVPHLSVGVHSATFIDFVNGDYIDYRGERFTLGYRPSVKKVSSALSVGDAFQWDDMVFQGVADELVRCKFLDVVRDEDEIIHYTSLPNFSFYAENATQLAERIQANLDRLYTGASSWTVRVADGAASRPYNFSFQNQSCWEALCKANEVWELDFIIRGRVITIGGVGNVIPHEFRYGKGNGLREVSVERNEGNLIATRVRAYGSTRNIPYRYYNKLYINATTGEVKYFKDNNIPAGWSRLLSESMYMPNLMLPTFTRGVAYDADGNELHIGDTDNSGERGISLGGVQGEDAWLDSVDGVDECGVIEDTVYFNEEDETGKDDDDIYPSMEGMTQSRLLAAGVPCDLDAGDNGNLDEVVGATQITDNGYLPDDGTTLEPSTFNITLKDIGFDINDYLTGEVAQISMKSGSCVGRTFDITEVVKQGNKYVLTCNRVVDDSLQLAFPYNDYNIAAADKFVLLHIYMPDVYVWAAEQRLYERAKRYVLENDHTKSTYAPPIDNIFLRRNPSIAANIKEGDVFTIYDDDLSISKIITISSLKIRDDYGTEVPEYEVSLSEENDADLISRVVSQASKNIFNTTFTRNQIANILGAVGKEMFLSKLNPDTAQGKITFYNGAVSDDVSSKAFASGFDGDGWRVWLQDGLSRLEVDELTVRRVMSVYELLIHKVRATGGAVIVSAADGKVKSVGYAQNGYDVEIEAVDGVGFENGDFVRCQRWDSANNTIKSYWVQVAGSYSNHIILQGDFTGGVPEAGDELVLMGSSNTARQGAVMISATEGGVPVVDVLGGIHAPSTAGCLRARLGCLDGIVDPYFDVNPNGYGIWSDNAWLRGEFHLRNGVDIGTSLAVTQEGINSTVKGYVDANVVTNPYFDGWDGWNIPVADVNNAYTQQNSSPYLLVDGDFLVTAGAIGGGKEIGIFEGLHCVKLDANATLTQNLAASALMDGVKYCLEVVYRGNLEYTFNSVLGGGNRDAWVTERTDATTVEIISDDPYPILITAGTGGAYVHSVRVFYLSESYVEQTADSVRLGVSNSLRNTGIDIENGLITLDAETTRVTGDLVAKSLNTEPTSGGARIEISGGKMQVFGADGFANWVWEVDSTGFPHLKCYRKGSNGEAVFLYDLGPQGISAIAQTTDTWESASYVTYDPTTHAKGSTSITLYCFIAARTNGAIIDPSKEPYDGKWYNADTVSSSGIPTGSAASGNYSIGSDFIKEYSKLSYQDCVFAEGGALSKRASFDNFCARTGCTLDYNSEVAVADDWTFADPSDPTYETPLNIYSQTYYTFASGVRSMVEQWYTN